MVSSSVVWTLYDPMDCNPPGSSVHGILQVRILEWVAIPFSGDLLDSAIKYGFPPGIPGESSAILYGLFRARLLTNSGIGLYEWLWKTVVRVGYFILLGSKGQPCLKIKNKISL